MTRFGAMLRALAVVAVATGMSTAALAQQKTAKQCRDEWRANEADFKARKIKEKDYVVQCQAGTATAQPAPAAPPPTKPAASTSGQKTAKQCRDEWRANEADFKAKKIKEKDYVAQCQAGTAPTPTAAPATSAPPATPAATTSGQKTAKQCRDEWRANEADFKAKKIREKDYVAQCQAGTAPAPTPTAAPATPSAPAPTTTAAPPPPPAPAPKTTAAPPPAPPAAPKPAPTATAAPTGANQFAAEAQAKAHCPSGLVVWVNTDSHIYHFSGHNDYGKTKQGAYMCETDALAAGDRAAKNEKHP